MSEKCALCISISMANQSKIASSAPSGRDGVSPPRRGVAHEPKVEPDEPVLYYEMFGENDEYVMVDGVVFERVIVPPEEAPDDAPVGTVEYREAVEHVIAPPSVGKFCKKI